MVAPQCFPRPSAYGALAGEAQQYLEGGALDHAPMPLTGARRAHLAPKTCRMPAEVASCPELEEDMDFVFLGRPRERLLHHKSLLREAARPDRENLLADGAHS